MRFLLDCVIIVTLALTSVLYQAVTAHPASHDKKLITTATANNIRQTKKTPSNTATSSKKKTATTNTLHDERPRTKNKSKQAVLMVLIVLCVVIVAGMLVAILPGKIIEYIKERILTLLEKKFG